MWKKAIIIVGVLSILILSLGCNTCDKINVTPSWISRSSIDIKPNEILTDGTTTATLKITVTNTNEKQIPIKINVDVPNAYQVYCREIVSDNPLGDFVKLKLSLHPETIGPKRSKEWLVEYKSINEIEGDYKINIIVTADDANCGVKTTATLRIYKK